MCRVYTHVIVTIDLKELARFAIQANPEAMSTLTISSRVYLFVFEGVIPPPASQVYVEGF